MLVVRPGGDREKQGDDDMGTDFPSDTSSTSTPTLQREVCDKCGSRMTLQSSAYGFERWSARSATRSSASTAIRRWAAVSRSIVVSRGTTPPTRSRTRHPRQSGTESLKTPARRSILRLQLARGPQEGSSLV